MNGRPELLVKTRIANIVWLHKGQKNNEEIGWKMSTLKIHISKNDIICRYDTKLGGGWNSLQTKSGDNKIRVTFPELYGKISYKCHEDLN